MLVADLSASVFQPLIEERLDQVAQVPVLPDQSRFYFSDGRVTYIYADLSVRRIFSLTSRAGRALALQMFRCVGLRNSVTTGLFEKRGECICFGHPLPVSDLPGYRETGSSGRSVSRATNLLENLHADPAIIQPA